VKLTPKVDRFRPEAVGRLAINERTFTGTQSAGIGAGWKASYY
jgi:hypothetical protein